MKEFAVQLADELKLGDFVLLKGDLGAGKTTFANLLINALKRGDVYVTSPTFNILQTYDYNGSEIWHMDLYRLKDVSELFQIGFDPFDESRIIIIEWPEMVERIVPAQKCHTIQIEVESDGARRMKYTAPR